MLVYQRLHIEAPKSYMQNIFLRIREVIWAVIKIPQEEFS